MTDSEDINKSTPDTLAALDTDQLEPKAQSEQHSKHRKIVNSAYFKIILTGVMMLLLFLTAFFIAVVSELREQKTEQLDLGVPPAKVIIPTPEVTSVPAADTSNWNTYSSDKYGLAFKYPENVEVKDASIVTRLNLVLSSEAPIFGMIAQTNYAKGDPDYYFDYPSTGEIKLGDYTWKTFYVPNYGGDGGSPPTGPFWGIRIEENSILYSVAVNPNKLTTLQRQILSTFQFLE